MKTKVSPAPDDWAREMPQYAVCPLHAESGVVYDAREGCPHCRKAAQSLTRYGLSNTLDAPMAGTRDRGPGTRGLAAGLALAVALLAGAFAWTLHRESRHLDQAVARIERASR